MIISIIIPTLNEASNIGELAESLSDLEGEFEVIVVDGGSNDCTTDIARNCGLNVIDGPRGRGLQMNTGALSAKGAILLFLHADTRLPINALKMIEEAMLDKNVYGGNFNLIFSGDSAGAGLLTYIYPFLRLGGMCYGDSAIFVRRSVFEEMGGYRDYPIFEDCDLYNRIRRTGRFVHLNEYAITSSRRFEGRFIRTFALWSLLQVLYWLGLHPKWLDKLYKVAR